MRKDLEKQESDYEKGIKDEMNERERTLK